MTTEEVTGQLFSVKNKQKDIPDEVVTYVDRLVLRLFKTSAGLTQYLDRFGVYPEEGDFIVELVFNKLPDEITYTVNEIIAAPDIEVSEKVDGDKTFDDYKIRLTPDYLGLEEDSQS